MAVKRISDLDSAVNIQETDLLAIVNGGETRKTTVADLNIAISSGSSPNAACMVATTANVNLTAGGLLTIDGVLLQADNRVLVWRQSNAAQNGIYLAKSGAWVRATDADETAEIRPGALISVIRGNAYKQSIFQVTNTGSAIVGTTAITYARLTGWTFNETTNIVSLTDRAIHISSLQVNGGLAKYDAQRHSQFDARTLVDKEYVDNKVSTVNAQWLVTGNDIYYHAGNVGIGTSTPAADLHVEGSFKFIDGNQQNGKVLVSDNSGNASWQSVSSDVFTSDFTVVLSGSKTLGKYTNGQVVPAQGKTARQVLLDLAVEYLAPAFNSFVLSGQNQTVELGTTIAAGNKTFTWSTANAGNIVANTLSIRNETAGTNLATGLANDGNQVVSLPGAIALLNEGSQVVFRITGQSTQVGNFTRDFAIVADYLRFYGTAATVPANSAAVRALAGSTFGNTFSISIPQGQTIIAFAYEATRPDITDSAVKYVEGFNSNVGNTFTKYTFTVNDAAGTARSYKIYVSQLGAPYPASATYNITIP
ncbi:hypothetical protein [Dawidia soli]|uniref:Uncharacterized protein n=1 Tax=Dawidia soli TaxID=2782352 RepID=A0AAP2GL10_9BACT|nr:hypothetical protein [Dawidia soli]MBT1690110.1 hypothetical protein [Dawidia soli]